MCLGNFKYVTLFGHEPHFLDFAVAIKDQVINYFPLGDFHFVSQLSYPPFGCGLNICIESNITLRWSAYFVASDIIVFDIIHRSRKDFEKIFFSLMNCLSDAHNNVRHH